MNVHIHTHIHKREREKGGSNRETGVAPYKEDQ